MILPLLSAGPGKGAVGLGQKALKRDEGREIPCGCAAASGQRHSGEQGKPRRQSRNTRDQTQVVVPAMQTRRRRANVTMVWVKVWLDSPGPAFSTPMSNRGT